MGCNPIQKANLNAVRILLLSHSDSAVYIQEKLKRVIHCKNFELLISNPLVSTGYTNYAMHKIMWYLDIWSNSVNMRVHWRYFLMTDEYTKELVNALSHRPYSEPTVTDEHEACNLINNTFRRLAAEYKLNN